MSSTLVKEHVFQQHKRCLRRKIHRRIPWLPAAPLAFYSTNGLTFQESPAREIVWWWDLSWLWNRHLDGLLRLFRWPLQSWFRSCRPTTELKEGSNGSNDDDSRQGNHSRSILLFSPTLYLLLTRIAPRSRPTAVIRPHQDLHCFRGQDTSKPPLCSRGPTSVHGFSQGRGISLRTGVSAHRKICPQYTAFRRSSIVHPALSLVDPRPSRISDNGYYNEREAVWRVPEQYNHLVTKLEASPTTSLSNYQIENIYLIGGQCEDQFYF